MTAGSRLLLSCIAAAAVAGCANAPTKRGFSWWAQGPGDSTAPSPQPAPPNPARDIEAELRAATDSVMEILAQRGLGRSDIASATLVVRVQGLPEEAPIQVPLFVDP